MDIMNCCFALMAHVDAGKTTLSESILFNTGMIREAGRVDHGSSFLDTESEERERGITIFSKQALFEIGNKHFTLIDTPGHVDFSAEMERVLSILDFAVLIISAPDGIHGHDLTLWRLLETYGVPAFVFVNKMDQPGTDKARILRELETRFGQGFVDFSDMEKEESRHDIFDAAAVLDDEIMEDYLENGILSDDQIAWLIRERKLFPCCFGSALKNEGVDQLLRFIARFSPNGSFGEEFGAKVFKISRDQKGNRRTHIRITGGQLKPKDTIMVNDIHGGEPVMEKVNRILHFSGQKVEQLDMAAAGMVVVLEGLEASVSGGTLGAEQAEHEGLMVPLFTSRVSSDDDVDVHKLYLKLKELEEEIPEISVNFNESAGEISMKLMGEVQTDIIKALVRERFDLRISFSPASIVYKETLTAPVIGAGHYEPLKHYAEVHLLMEPAERGSGVEICSALSEDVLPRHFQRLIMTNIGEKKHLGVLTGSELTDVRITLINARAHEKHTEGGDFRESVYRAVRYGMMKAAAGNKTMLLEPYYEFELRVPDKSTGRAMTDLALIAEKFDGPVSENGESVFTGRAAVSAMQGYGAQVLAYTGGFGSLNAVFGGYGPCLKSEEVIAACAYDPELDLENQSGSVFCTHGAGYYVPWYEADAYFHLDLKGEEAILYGNNSDKTETNIEQVGISESNTKKIKESGTSGKSGKTDYLGAGIQQDKELEEIFYRNLGGNRGRNASDDYGWSTKKSGRSMNSAEKKSVTNDGKVQINAPKKQYLLVDGYNIIFAWQELKELAAVNIDAARNALQDILANYQGFRGMTLILVFDAYRVKGGKGSVEKYHNIYVVYTMEAQTADAYIEKTVHEIGRKERVTVATSDGLEQTIVFGEGAVRMSARELYEEVKMANADISREFLERKVKLENKIDFDA